MIGTQQQKRRNFFSSCIVPLLTVIGLVAGCFLLCMAIFLLNQASIQT